MTEFRSLVETKLRDLEARALPLLKRKSEVLIEVESLTAEINSLMPELLEVSKAAEAIGIHPKNIEDYSEFMSDISFFEDKPSNSSGMTIKQAVRLVLNGQASGLSSGDILDQINKEYWDGRLDRTSFSPQLSRMKRDGEVDLNAGVYNLTQQGRTAGNLVRHRIRPAPNRLNVLDEADDGSTARQSSIFE